MCNGQNKSSKYEVSVLEVDPDYNLDLCLTCSRPVLCVCSGEYEPYFMKCPPPLPAYGKHLQRRLVLMIYRSKQSATVRLPRALGHLL